MERPRPGAEHSHLQVAISKIARVLSAAGKRRHLYANKGQETPQQVRKIWLGMSPHETTDETVREEMQLKYRMEIPTRAGLQALL